MTRYLIVRGTIALVPASKLLGPGANGCHGAGPATSSNPSGCLVVATASPSIAFTAYLQAEHADTDYIYIL